MISLSIVIQFRIAFDLAELILPTATITKYHEIKKNTLWKIQYASLISVYYLLRNRNRIENILALVGRGLSKMFPVAFLSKPVFQYDFICVWVGRSLSSNVNSTTRVK